MKKRNMSTVKIKEFSLERFQEQFRGDLLIVGLDIAKIEQYASLCDGSGAPLAIVRWRMPGELPVFIELLMATGASRIEVVMEPSGTYGDAIRVALHEAGVAVFRASPKRVFDAREVFDGIPGLHDKKSSILLARMHVQGLTALWEPESEETRDLRAALSLMDHATQSIHLHCSRLEALMARHWPEAESFMKLDSVTLLTLLSKIGGPACVASRPQEAVRLMSRTGRTFLKESKIQGLMESAALTVGMKTTALEEALLVQTAARALAARTRRREAEKVIRKLTESNVVVNRLSAVVGHMTAAVLVSDLGDPRDYENAKALEKAAGLTLKEKSSGAYHGPRSITKRGPKRTRRWPYFAALRLIKDDAITRAWFARKTARDGGVKMKGVVAVMRKLLRALWHVAQGERFDTSKLFDVSRLNIAS